MRIFDEIFLLQTIFGHAVEAIVREPCGYQRLVEYVDLRDMYLLAVPIGFGALPCVETLVTGDLVHHAYHYLALVCEGYADAIRRKTVHIVGSAVERVYYPNITVTLRPDRTVGRIGGLLCEEIGTRYDGGERIHYHLLGLVIDTGNHIVHTLELDIVP